MIDRLLLGFGLPVSEYCFAVLCSAAVADTHLKLLDRVVSSARFQTRGCFLV